MNRGKLIFITGGARSGKSRFAEEMAGKTGKKVAYIATGQPKDSEMKARIQKHKVRRPTNWQTFEEPIKVKALIDKIGLEKEVILIDCLTLLTSNLLLRREEKIGDEMWQEEVLSEIKKLAEGVYKVPARVIIVSNEVGMGLVPDNPLGRFYRDILGRANNIIAGMADEVILMVSGIPIKIKGE
jgi:adenosylcobinamide kinase/adenosylcobinamide-phosphate guanylyltransferase